MEENENKVKTVEVEEKKDETTIKPENPVVNGEKQPEVEPKKAEQTVEEKTDETKTVDNTEEQGNGIPLSEVALKSDVASMIKEAVTSLQSKLDAVVKENEDLKEQLAKAKGETEEVRKKYEDNGDFGTSQKKGAGFTDDKAKSSRYVSYEEMWNGANQFDKS